MLGSVSPNKCQCSLPSQKMHWKHSEWLNLKILPRISHQTSTAIMIHFLEEKKKNNREISVNFQTILSFKTYYTYSNKNTYHSPFKEYTFIYIAGKVQVHWNSRAALAGVTSFKIICIKVTVKHKWPDECKTKTCNEISGKRNGWSFKILQL